MVPVSAKKKLIKKSSPRRSLKGALQSLGQVISISRVPDEHAFTVHGRGKTEHLPAKTSFRVCAWNVCKGIGAKAFEHEFKMLLRSHTLLLIQEALLTPEASNLYGQTGFESIHATSYIRRDGLRDGVLTLSTVRGTGKPLRIISKKSEPILQTPKAAVVSFYPIEGRSETLMVINVHARLIRTQKSAGLEMQHLIETLPPHKGPIIFGGDFNTFTTRHLSQVTESLKNLGLELVRIPDDPRRTRHALDQIYVKGLTIEEASIDTTVKNSDHFPILLKCAF